MPLEPLLEELLLVLHFCLLPLQSYLPGGDEGNHRSTFLMYLVGDFGENGLK